MPGAHGPVTARCRRTGLCALLFPVCAQVCSVSPAQSLAVALRYPDPPFPPSIPTPTPTPHPHLYPPEPALEPIAVPCKHRAALYRRSSHNCTEATSRCERPYSGESTSADAVANRKSSPCLLLYVCRFIPSPHLRFALRIKCRLVPNLAL
jgi:hypothetical protein